MCGPLSSIIHARYRPYDRSFQFVGPETIISPTAKTLGSRTTRRQARLSSFAETLDSGKFAVTCELNPPKGVELGPLLEKAEMLKGMVDAFNITDSAASRMSMAPIGAAHLLQDRGVETILQITGRDRNRIAIQAELLAAHALGVTNVLCMSGDPPGGGDHPDAKAVFDLDAIGLLRAVESMEQGTDVGGNDLKGAPAFRAGAVANPGSPGLDSEIKRLGEKIEAGASFFQTQAVYDPEAFGRFAAAAKGFNVPILAGMIVLKSARMARNLNANLPGVFVPDALIEELDGAESRSDTSVEISARIIKELRGVSAGVHIMAIGWEDRIPRILEAAGLRS